MNRVHNYFAKLTLTALFLFIAVGLNAQNVTVTTAWLDFHGSVTDVNGNDLAPGALVQAFDQDGILSGEFVIQEAGAYGFMPVYEDDPLTPNVDEGAEEGDVITFMIDGNDAAVANAVVPTWSLGIDKLNIDLTLGEVTSVGGNHESVPAEFALHQNYPNPFNPGTEIRYSIPVSHRESLVRLIVYDLSGKVVRTLINEPQSSGSYHIPWDGTNDAGKPVASGIYLYEFRTRSIVISRKMLLLR